MLIEFQPYDWKEATDIKGCLELRAISFDKDSNRQLIRVKNFPYICMIELPATVGGIKKTWDETNSSDVVSSIKRLLRNTKLIATKFTNRKNLYFHNSKASYIAAYFSNKSSMQLCYSMLHNKSITVYNNEYNPYTSRYESNSYLVNLNVWENDVTPDVKLMAVKGLERCNWMTCEAELVKEEDKICKLEKEYITRYSSLEKVERDYIIYPMVASMDIEVNSKRKLCFPNPWKTSDDIYMINIIFQRLGKPDTRESHCIITTDCNEVDGVVLHKVKSEKDAVHKMAELYLKYDTSFVIQWNGMAFDWRYISVRMAKVDLELPDMSLLYNDKTWIYEKSWESKAFGTNFNYIPQTFGMIHVDMMLIVKRLQTRFMKYTLDFIAKELLGKTKHDLTAFEMFTIYQELVKAKRDNRRGKCSNDELEKRIEDMTRTIKYCEQDCILPLEIMIKLDTYQELIQTSNICCVNIIDIYTKGAQIKGINRLYQDFYKNGYVMNYAKSSIDRYDGAHVFKPCPGYHRCIICLDFQSLYPSIMIDNNLCYTTIIPEEKWSLYSTDEYKTYMVPYRQKVNPYDKNCKQYIRLIKEIRVHKEPGQLPKTLKCLLDERVAVRKEQALEKDPSKKSILNCRQLALKLQANSIYGLTGMAEEAGGRLIMKEVAMITTYKGKMHIKNDVQHYIETVYKGKLIYGDTDSGFIHLGIDDPIECLYYGIRLCHEFNGGPELVNPSGLNVTLPASKGIFEDKVGRRLKLEFEKGMMLVLETKKRYTYLIINKLGFVSNDINKVMAKGNMVAKRERCSFLRNIYLRVSYMILMHNSFYEVLHYIKSEVKRLLDDKVDVKELIELRNMGKSYKLPNYPLKLLSDRLISIGKDVKPGDRLELVIINTEDPKHKLGNKLRLYEEYLESSESGESMEIDYLYYIEKLLAKQLDKLIGIVFGKLVEEKYSKIKFNTNKRYSVNLSQPCLMMMKMLKRDMSFNKVLKAVKRIDKA